MILGLLIFFTICELAFGYLIWIAVTATIPTESKTIKIIIAIIICLILIASIYHTYIFMA